MRDEIRIAKAVRSPDGLCWFFSIVSYRCELPGALQNFTCGTCFDASLAWKYALLGWKPRMPAQMLLGNCRMKVL
jgi:hypothetical protein